MRKRADKPALNTPGEHMEVELKLCLKLINGEFDVDEAFRKGMFSLLRDSGVVNAEVLPGALISMRSLTAEAAHKKWRSDK